MRTPTSTRDERRKLVLLPIKVYAIAAFVASQAYINAFPRRRDVDTEALVGVILGYALCFFVLLGDGVVQALGGRGREGVNSLVFAGLSVLFGWILLPELAQP